MSNKIKAIKGMDGNMRCRNFQYEQGQTYTMPEDEVSMCHSGFHAIDGDECPLSVFHYYPPSSSRYFEVEIGGKIDKKDEKIVGSEISTGAEIGILGLVKAHIEWVKRNLVKDDKPEAHKKDNRSVSSNTGDYSSAEVSGKESIAAVFGKNCKARGALGCWLVLTERGELNGETYPIKEVRSVKVDGKIIKENTWYKLEDGEVKEVE